MGGGDGVEAGREDARTSLGRGWGAFRAEGLVVAASMPPCATGEGLGSLCGSGLCQYPSGQ